MNNMTLYPHQKEGLEQVKNLNRVAFYWDMGLGKTFVGAEKMLQLGSHVNLIVCQKSKVEDWIDHFETYYTEEKPFCIVTDLTKVKAEMMQNLFLKWCKEAEEHAFPHVYVINYDLVFRRPILKKLRNFTLLLDESSLIQNETAKRSKFILSLKPDNIILLSGTPTGGKYERLWSQLHLLGWNISKDMFYNHYVDYHWDDSEGFPIMIIDGYKNETRLKKKMREYGCKFLKTEEVFDLPEKTDIPIVIPATPEYKKFRKNSLIEFKHNGAEIELIGATILTRFLYERQLCGQYNKKKLEAFKDLIESTNDRLIVFYNFNEELIELKKIAEECGREIGFINGSGHSMYAYEYCKDGITFVQYQAGAMGLNLQKANKIIYFTPPVSSELFEQSKKRIHRIGQNRPCFYYYLMCGNSIEQAIYGTLAKRKDYTDALFKEDLKI
jgi:SNF2 family DNA or RNA helicase